MIRRQRLISRYFKNVRFHKDDEAKLTFPLTGGTRQSRTQSAFNLSGEFASIRFGMQSSNIEPVRKKTVRLLC